MRTVRSVLRALGALIAVLLAAGSFRCRSRGPRERRASRTLAASAARARHLHHRDDPTTAGPNSTVTVSGTLANHTGAAVCGITVQAMTSTGWFHVPRADDQFANGTATGTVALPLHCSRRDADQVTGTVPNGATVHWSVSFPAGIFYDQFGVFPIQVQAAGAGTAYTATARTFLPFWPGGSTATQPKGLQVAWVWPLIDTPQQGACPQTLSDIRARQLRRFRRPPVHPARRGRRLGPGRPADLGHRPRAALRRVRDDALLLHARQRRLL